MDRIEQKGMNDGVRAETQSKKVPIDGLRDQSSRSIVLFVYLCIVLMGLGLLGVSIGLTRVLDRGGAFATPVGLLMVSLFLLIFVLALVALILFIRRDKRKVSAASLSPMKPIGQHRPEEQSLILLSAVEQSPNAVLITDRIGSIVYVNPKFVRMTGYSYEEVFGKNPRILQSERSAHAEYQAMWESLNSGAEWKGVIQDKKKNGELYWAQETISCIQDSEGVITNFLAIQEDITERKQLQEALRQSEERFRLMAVMTGEWIWELDASGHYVYCSSAVKNILGYEPDELLGQHYLELLRPKHGETMAAAFANNATSEKGFSGISNHYFHRNGDEIITQSTGRAVFDAQGKLIKWRGVDRDMTVHKLYEDALRLRDRAINAASVGIVIADAGQKNYPTIFANQAFSKMTGYSQEEFIGRNLSLLQGPDTDRFAINKVRQALREGQGCEVLFKNYRKDGAAFWNELVISPVHDEQGKLTHYIGVQNDVTQVKRAEEERQGLEIAKQIQQSLLPKAPLTLEKLHIAGYCLPALQVGGDYFDYFRTEEAVDMVIADVSGHSIAAALIMVETRSTLKAETSNLIKSKTSLKNSAANILHVLNDLLYDDLSRAELFITMFYTKYDMATGQLNYANAGHNPALLLRHDATRCTPLDAEGLVLGVNQNVAFEEKSLVLETGDMVLLYTDGIIEAQNRKGEFFGIKRLCSAFTGHDNRSAQGIIDHLLNELKLFSQSSSFIDDVSMLVLKII